MGVINQGEFEVHLDGLDSGKTYFYRFLADNSLTAWSNVGTFTTDSLIREYLESIPDQMNSGMNAGIFWDRNNGDGEQKMYDATVSTFSYQAPDGSAWKVTKASFTIEGNLLFGENLDEVRLEGVNSISLDVDGNITIAKNLIGAPAFDSTHYRWYLDRWV